MGLKVSPPFSTSVATSSQRRSQRELALSTTRRTSEFNHLISTDTSMYGKTVEFIEINTVKVKNRKGDLGMQENKLSVNCMENLLAYMYLFHYQCHNNYDNAIDIPRRGCVKVTVNFFKKQNSLCIFI